MYPKVVPIKITMHFSHFIYRSENYKIQDKEKLYAKIAGFYSTFQNNLLCLFGHFAEFIHMLCSSSQLIKYI